MIRLLLPLLLLAALAAVVFMALASRRLANRRRDELLVRVRRVTDLAFLHDEISTGLADAIITRTRGLGSHTEVRELETALDDILAAAREHRAQEPDLAVIVIDTVRSNELE